jgi:lipopolysaccharide export system permease protein
MQFLINTLDKLVGKGLEEIVILQLVILNIPWMLVLAVPMGILFGSLMAFGSMSASHEVTVVKSSGGSLFRMMRPLILISILLTGFMFWFNDVVLPESNHKAKTLINDIKKKKPTFILESGQFSDNIDGYTILARDVDSLTSLMRGVTIYDKKNSRSTNIINSDSGRILFDELSSKMILKLYHGEIHQNKYLKQENYRIVKFTDYQINLNATGFSFNRTDEELISRGQREMTINDMENVKKESIENSISARASIEEKISEHIDNILVQTPNIDSTLKEIDHETALKRVQKSINFLSNQLSSYYNRVDKFDTKARQFEVEIQKKYSIPFACFIFMFVGCPLGIVTRKGNFGISAAISLGIYIIYWICLIGGEKLADRGIVDAHFSMWLGNIIVGVIGILVTLKVSLEIDINPITLIKNIFSKRKE